MGKKKRKKKPLAYATYNRKEFLAPESIRSMSAIQTKIYEDGTAIIRISDCHRSVKIWNNIGEKEEVQEFLEKINTVISSLDSFRNEIMSRHEHYQLFAIKISKPAAAGTLENHGHE